MEKQLALYMASTGSSVTLPMLYMASVHESPDYLSSHMYICTYRRRVITNTLVIGLCCHGETAGSVHGLTVRSVTLGVLLMETKM